MTMRLKFSDGLADQGLTEFFWKPLNLEAKGNVLEDRAPHFSAARDLDVRARAAQARTQWAEEMPRWGSAVAGAGQAERRLQRGIEPGAQLMEAGAQLMEQDALTEMLQEMSLSTLLYYVLIEGGRDEDESS